MARRRRSHGALVAMVLGAVFTCLCPKAFVLGPGRSGGARVTDPSSMRRKAQDADDSFTAEADTFKEMDRRSRRDVFGYQDWKRHRSTMRYFRNLQTTFSSSFARFIWIQVLFSTIAAALVWVYYEVLGNAAPSISALPFTATSSVLSLLLVFRTNQCFGRWWEARKIWGSITNKCRDLTRQTLVRIKDQDVHLREPTVALTACFPRVLMFHLGAQDAQAQAELTTSLQRLLPAHEASVILEAKHKPMTLVGLLTENFKQATMHPIERMKADNILTDFSDYYGMCERILKTPMPLVYTRYGSRFLSIWLLALPFALYSQTTPHWLIIPITGLIAFFIFGIAEVAIQIEEPFSILPLMTMCGGIEASCFEAYELKEQWEKEAKKELVP